MNPSIGLQFYCVETKHLGFSCAECGIVCVVGEECEHSGAARQFAELLAVKSYCNIQA